VTVCAVNIQSGVIKCERPNVLNSHELYRFGPWEYKIVRDKSGAA
jgi:hypothetical protein